MTLRNLYVRLKIFKKKRNYSRASFTNEVYYGIRNFRRNLILIVSKERAQLPTNITHHGRGESRLSHRS